MTLRWRGGGWAVYQSPYAAPSFDVFRVRVRPAERIVARDYPERECYPGAEEWGTEAFSVSGWPRVTALLASIGITAPESMPA